MLVMLEHEAEDPTPIGMAVAKWRARRGMTEAELARSSGLSQRLIADVEAGRDWVDRVHVLSGLAAGLRLDPADLAGQPYAPRGAEHAAVHAMAWHLRHHLAQVVVGRPAGVVDVDELVEGLEAVKEAEEEGRLSTVALVLPPLLELSDRLTLDTSRRSEAALLRAAAYTAAARLLRRLGYRDLAWSVLDQVRSTAGARMIVLAEEVRMLLAMGLAQCAVVRVERERADELSFEVLLVVSVAQASLGNGGKSRELLDAAQVLATGAAEQSAVASARAFAAVEFGALEAALDHAEQVVALAAGPRARLLVLKASVCVRLGAFAQAMGSLVEAEAIAPIPMSLDPLAREVIAALSARVSGRDATVLAGIAMRCGIR
ncbi:helix-turn-helix domain-containing protein [Streptomyces sp. NPDC020883]|uniref:helix-turn-helix domain-containing protein n=1 Tax=Streptomyces sp. NPDC020883 TaxID=3365099 RepID=UPI00379C3849